MTGIDEAKKRIDENKISRDKCYYNDEYTNMCYLDISGEVPVIKFRCMEKYDYITLAFSTRLCGVSHDEEFLESLNFGWDRGDKDENVRENYKRICRSIGGDYRKLVLSDQVHDNKVMYVDERYEAGERIEKKIKGIDGLTTDKEGIILATSYADCVPLFFFDPVRKVIASSHSGWRGTVGFIGSETIEKMKKLYGSKAEDIICIVGPSICQECYEVSEDVIEEFKKAYDKSVWNDIFYKKNDGKYQLDLWAANYHQFRKCSIPHEHIFVSGLCTCCNSDILYSHRASHGKRGNLNGFMMINNVFK